MVLTLVVAVSLLLSQAQLPAQSAALPPAAAEARLTALVGEWTQHALAGRGFGVLPQPDQASGDAAWADGFLARLRSLPQDQLTHDQWITYATLENDATLMKEAARFFWFAVPITPYASPLRAVSGALAAMPIATEAARQAYLDALHRLPVTFASYEARLRSQADRGIVVPAEELRLAVPYIRGFGGDAAASPLRPQQAALASLPEDVRTAFVAKVDAALNGVVAPAVERLAAYIDGPYRAKAPASVGVAQYPNGRAYYEYLIRRHTSLALSPEQIHRIGLDEVARLETALDAVRREAKFAGTLAEFRAYLRDDPRFRATSASDIGDRMMAATRRIEPQVREFFPLQPKAPYGVRRLDPALEQAMTYGYYQMPLAGEPRGVYMFNAFRPEQRSILMAEATIYHELVPGHHFQIMLQRENAALIPYRRTYFFTAFTEGWAEYASDLAGEMGMYSDPYQRAGRVAMDLFLSSRLVVDTGMNALGWTREKAVVFMREHTFESDLQIDTETLRYSADYHGQALAYKLGARTFHALRDRAKAAMGSKFDLPAFHAYVLRAGAMPLSVLEGHVDCFIRERHQLQSPAPGK